MALDRNILVILTSGMRADVAGSLRTWPIVPVHLNMLAEASLEFTAVAASPAALPALVSLYTGLYPRQHGVLDGGPPPQLHGGWLTRLRERGYHTAGVGRVMSVRGQLDEAACVAEVGELACPDCEYLAYARKRGVSGIVRLHRERRLRSGPLEPVDDGLSHPELDVDGFIARQATEMIERMPTDRPWVLVAAFTGPGNDLPVPKLYEDVADAGELQDGLIPPDFAEIDTYADLPWSRSLLQGLTPKRLAEIRRHYLGRVGLLDHHVAVLREAVDRHGHARKTWIAFAADHGKLLGEGGIIGERSFLNGATQTPLWIMPPDGAEPIERDEQTALTDGLVSNIDLARTLCAIGTADEPLGCLGRSVLPAVKGHEVGGDHALSEFADRVMMETAQHKVVFHLDEYFGDPAVLFDLFADPHERRNLMGTPEASNVLDMLRWQLADVLLPLRPVKVT